MKRNKKGKRIEKLKRNYKLVLMDANSFEEKLSFRVSRLGVIIVSASVMILLISLTIYLIAFTSLREYIPGYTDVTLARNIYDLQQKTDSLENVFRQKDIYINNLNRLISGNIADEVEKPDQGGYANYDTITSSISSEDSMLRAEYENQTKYNLYQDNLYNYLPANLGNINFFPPLKGIITHSFDPSQDLFGVDIVAKTSEAIKATFDGTVIFSDWTLETGYIIGIQHKNNLISVYKHNSSILKQQGTFVKAGETISIVGQSGELSTGPHLHFELWYNGKPIDPEEFISF